MKSGQNPDVRESTTRGRILLAAIAIIEREGAERATVRTIAAEAGVNIAAINYHYRTKEELLEAAILATWRHALGDLRSFFGEAGGSIAAGLEGLALYLLRGGRQYPRVTRAHLLGCGGIPAPAEALAGQKAFVSELAGIVAAALGRACDEKLVVRTGIFLSFCLFSGLVPESLPDEIRSADFGISAGVLVSDYLASIHRTDHHLP